MSSTLTWRRTSAAKTGTAIANLIDDIVSAVNAVSSDADYKWQVASSNNASTPYYVVLKRKNGDPGRVLIVHWSSSPAGNNSAILDATPSNTQVHMAYFPAGNADSPSNLTASSGTILGDDTGCTKVIPFGPVLSTLYGTNIYPVVWDSEEAVHFTFQNSGNANAYWAAAGGIYVNASDDAVFGVASSSATINNFGASSTTQPAYSTSAPSAGGNASTTANVCMRAIVGGANVIYYFAYGMNGGWHQLTSNNPMLNSGLNRAWFEPILLLCRDPGIGKNLKLRQFALGVPVTGSFGEYNSSTLTPAAINANGNSGSTTSPWFCNFKV